ncbi:hypothetical protein MVEN_01313500 [Mycena venus]|uniref:Uncharacterized protein n=1 Tax=Mycena venus TaxID=2733690 RepID=A0A8H6Y0F3_9AGAR|nr:hypothetical protein MVEN_01313500 [Mycena venus]
MSLHYRQNNIPLGPMTSKEFSQWINGASESIQNSIITDLSWWAQRDTVLHHQFLLLRFEHLEPGGSMQFYEVRLERAGKVITSLAGQALDTVIVSIPPPVVDPEFFKGHKLLLALLTHPEIVPSPHHNPGQNPRSTGDAGPPTTNREPEEIFHYDAFVDFLDHKWRGPSATLRDLGRYLPAIVQQNSRYSLASTNCFWFSRLITHTIALRHYSFPHLAISIEPSKYVIPRTADIFDIGTADWRKHDPSSISLLFRYLHYEEWQNGILMYRRLIIIIFSVFPIATCTGVPYVLYRGSDRTEEWRKVILVVLMGPLLLFLVTGVVILIVRQVVAGLTSSTIRRKTDGVMRALDREFTAPPQAARGDYVPLPIPLVRVRDEVRHIRLARGGNSTYHMEVARGPRSLPTLWENEHQIFAEKRQDYEESWRLLFLRAARRTRRDGSC